MTDWVPPLASRPGPRYIAIVDSLAEDISSGRVKPGTRLLPQRDLAERLGLSVGTVSKAYAEAEQRGLISGEVGRGTFVRGRRRSSPDSERLPAVAINLALNVSPDTGSEVLIADTLAEIVSDGQLPGLLGYLPHQGLREHREQMADWLGRLGVPADPDLLLVTHGAQHALSIAASLIVGRGEPVLTESLTYSGMIALSAQGAFPLHGIAMDRQGMRPEALEQAFAETGARLLYCMPSLQTPTGAIMPEERRKVIAEIVRRHDAYLLEDDTYAFLFEAPPAPISTMIPERSFYVASFAKCLAPGLRIGAMVVPESFRDRSINAVRATGWMAVAAMAEVVARLIRNGALDREILAKRQKAALRNDIARRLLKGWLAPSEATPGFHVWLPLPAGRTLTALIAQAAQAGLTIAPPHALRPNDPGSLGVRLCLGGPSTEHELEDALVELRRILEQAEAISLV
jgi:DNA-binding transcriptional MocR family regulator